MTGWTLWDWLWLFALGSGTAFFMLASLALVLDLVRRWRRRR